jgi:peroxiredoxin
MRIVILLGMLWAFGWSAFAQEKAIVSGKVRGWDSDTILIAIQRNSLDPNEQQFSAPIDRKGRFRFEIPLAEATIAELVYGDDGATIYLTPGETLAVSFRADKMIPSISFRGSKVGENRYLAKFEKKFIENEAYQVLPDIIFYQEAEFTVFLDERRENMLDFLEKYDHKYQYSPEFKAYALAEIEYAWANDKLIYPDLREHIVNGQPRLNLTASYYEFLSRVNLNDLNALSNPAYTTFLKNYFQYQSSLGYRRKTDKDYYKANYEAAKKVLQGDIRSHVLGQILVESFRFGHIRHSEEMLADYRKLNPKTEYLSYLEVLYAGNRKFSLGSPAPAFKFTTAKGDTVQLSDFKGKLVYLSFWTTTCGLCLMDMSHAQNLANKLDGKPIVFISIGMDENKMLWQNMVTKKTLSGIHVYASGDKSAIIKNYSLGDLPAYFLIDDDGTFLSVKPKRPSSAEAARELLQAFEQKPGFGAAAPPK